MADVLQRPALTHSDHEQMSHTDSCFCLSRTFIEVNFWNGCAIIFYTCSQIVSIPFHSRLRSADNDDMIVPRTQTVCYGPCSFHIAAPQIWNMLPPHLKNSNICREQFSQASKLGSLCKPTHKRHL